MGLIVNSSGTIGNVQFAAGRGIPSIALSAGPDTIDNATLADPDSAIVAGLTIKLLNELEARSKPGQPLLPHGVALNVNFPTGATPSAQFAFSRIGTFQLYDLAFKNTPPYGLTFGINDPSTATRWQAEDEAVVNATKVSVTAMQVSFDHNLIVQHWLQKHLRRLFR